MKCQVNVSVGRCPLGVLLLLRSVYQLCSLIPRVSLRLPWAIVFCPFRALVSNRQLQGVDLCTHCFQRLEEAKDASIGQRPMY